MKTRSREGILHVLGLVSALLVLTAAAASAQQTLQVPPPQLQSAPPPRYHPRATPTPAAPGSEVRTLPPVYQATPPIPPPPTPEYEARPAPTPISPAPQAVPPVLPAIFRGCWVGEVRYLDSIKRLPGAAKIGTWTPKTYRLCYRKIGNGPFTLTFTEAGVAHSNKITNAAGRMTLISSDGRSYASMRAYLHFDEYRVHSAYFEGNTFPVDELTNLQCDIEPDGMHVWGQVYGERKGEPWFRAWWHTVFRHEGEPPELPPATSAGGIPE